MEELTPIMKLIFKDIQGQLDRIEGAVKRVEGHAAHTNGRVTKLEKYQTGIVMCLSLIVIVIIPLLTYAFKLSQDNLKYEILNGSSLTSAIEGIVERNYNFDK